MQGWWQNCKIFKSTYFEEHLGTIAFIITDWNSLKTFCFIFSIWPPVWCYTFLIRTFGNAFDIVGSLKEADSSGEYSFYFCLALFLFTLSYLWNISENNLLVQKVTSAHDCNSYLHQWGNCTLIFLTFGVFLFNVV